MGKLVTDLKFVQNIYIFKKIQKTKEMSDFKIVLENSHIDRLSLHNEATIPTILFSRGFGKNTNLRISQYIEIVDTAFFHGEAVLQKELRLLKRKSKYQAQVPNARF